MMIPNSQIIPNVQASNSNKEYIYKKNKLIRKTLNLLLFGLVYCFN